MALIGLPKTSVAVDHADEARDAETEIPDRGIRTGEIPKDVVAVDPTATRNRVDFLADGPMTATAPMIHDQRLMKSPAARPVTGVVSAPTRKIRIPPVEGVEVDAERDNASAKKTSINWSRGAPPSLQTSRRPMPQDADDVARRVVARAETIATVTIGAVTSVERKIAMRTETAEIDPSVADVVLGVVAMSEPRWKTISIPKSAPNDPETKERKKRAPALDVVGDVEAAVEGVFEVARRKHVMNCPLRTIRWAANQPSMMTMKTTLKSKPFDVGGVVRDREVVTTIPIRVMSDAAGRTTVTRVMMKTDHDLAADAVEEIATIRTRTMAETVVAATCRPGWKPSNCSSMLTSKTTRNPKAVAADGVVGDDNSRVVFDSSPVP